MLLWEMQDPGALTTVLTWRIGPPRRRSAGRAIPDRSCARDGRAVRR